jgi:nucleoid-associated protein YgaU
MPNDAKFGMIVGVGVVIAIAMVFFRKDPGSNLPLTSEAAAATVAAPSPASPDTLRGSYRPVRAKTAIQTDTPVGALRSEQRHVVAEGDTLFSLAQHYYGDKGRFGEIYQMNRECLATPDLLTPGMVLLIPQLPDPDERRE